MLVSSLTDSDREATFVALGSFFPLIVLSGKLQPELPRASAFCVLVRLLMLTLPVRPQA